jgi:hypothetical protein
MTAISQRAHLTRGLVSSHPINMELVRTPRGKPCHLRGASADQLARLFKSATGSSPAQKP